MWTLEPVSWALIPVFRPYRWDDHDKTLNLSVSQLPHLRNVMRTGEMVCTILLAQHTQFMLDKCSILLLCLTFKHHAYVPLPLDSPLGVGTCSLCSGHSVVSVPFHPSHLRSDVFTGGVVVILSHTFLEW